MTPEQHAKAIEDAAIVFKTLSNIFEQRPNTIGQVPGALRAMERIQAALRVGVGAAAPKDSAEFALAALVAAGHVSQSKVDYARALMPETPKP